MLNSNSITILQYLWDISECRFGGAVSYFDSLVRVSGLSERGTQRIVDDLVAQGFLVDVGHDMFGLTQQAFDKAFSQGHNDPKATIIWERPSKLSPTQDELSELRELIEKTDATNKAWQWSDVKIDEEDGYQFFPQGSYLDDTLVTLGDNYENCQYDCRYISLACRLAPKLLALIK